MTPTVICVWIMDEYMSLKKGECMTESLCSCNMYQDRYIHEMCPSITPTVGSVLT